MASYLLYTQCVSVHALSKKEREWAVWNLPLCWILLSFHFKWSLVDGVRLNPGRFPVIQVHPDEIMCVNAWVEDEGRMRRECRWGWSLSVYPWDFACLSLTREERQGNVTQIKDRKLLQQCDTDFVLCLWWMASRWRIFNGPRLKVTKLYSVFRIFCFIKKC